MKKIIILAIAILGFSFICNAGSWDIKFKRGDELKGTADEYENIYYSSDIFSFSSRSSDIELYSANSIFDYNEDDYVKGRIGFYENDKLIESIDCKFHVYGNSKSFCRPLNYKLNAKIIYHLKYKGNVRFIIRKYNDTNLDITVPFNSELKTFIDETNIKKYNIDVNDICSYIIDSIYDWKILFHPNMYCYGFHNREEGTHKNAYDLGLNDIKSKLEFDSILYDFKKLSLEGLYSIESITNYVKGVYTHIISKKYINDYFGNVNAGTRKWIKKYEEYNANIDYHQENIKKQFNDFMNSFYENSPVDVNTINTYDEVLAYVEYVLWNLNKI